MQAAGGAINAGVAYKEQEDAKQKAALDEANKKAADKKAKADKKKADKKGKGKDAKKKDDTEKKSKIPDWKLVAPKDGKTTMTRDGKKYYWCPNHHTKLYVGPSRTQGLQQGS